ncbi:hypothetical protein [Actinomadura sp. 9N407]|uniref:hypothetical protein n=1 Tax=Actinomadura sp. 9N407 TaxID=3375154 RepID=UPI00379571D8
MSDGDGRHDGQGRTSGPEILSAADYAVQLRYDSNGRSFGEGGAGTEPGGASPVEAECASPVKGLEEHVCMGLNACNGFDVDRKAFMAGAGNCATVHHVCHGEGMCRGQGGCGYAGSDEQQWRPGDQACRYNGSCASPINISRVFSGGPMKGKSVWLQARRLMEDRMYRAGLAFGPAPSQGIPDDLLPHYDIDKEEIPPSKAEPGGKAQGKKSG